MIIWAYIYKLYENIQEEGGIVWKKRKEKAKESIQAVLPILFIVLLLSFTVAPVSASILLEFMIGAVFVIIGMLFFFPWVPKCQCLLWGNV